MENADSYFDKMHEQFPETMVSGQARSMIAYQRVLEDQKNLLENPSIQKTCVIVVSHCLILKWISNFN